MGIDLGKVREAVGWVRNALRDHDLFRAGVRLDELEALLVEAPPVAQDSSAGSADEGKKVTDA